MDKLEIMVQPRTVQGKKVKKLREQGWIPANVYGHGIESYPIQVEAKELEQVIRSAGTSKLIGLRLPSSREVKRVLVREVRREPTTHKLLHVDFYQVRMSEKLKAEVPLVFTGEAPAAEGGHGVLMHNMTAVEVESLPGNLPESIKVDVSGLESFDDAIHVSDLKAPAGVTILTPSDELVAKVAPVRVEKEEVKEEEAAAAPPEEAAQPTEGEEKEVA